MIILLSIISVSLLFALIYAGIELSLNKQIITCKNLTIATLESTIRFKDQTIKIKNETLAINDKIMDEYVLICTDLIKKNTNKEISQILNKKQNLN